MEVLIIRLNVVLVSEKQHRHTEMCPNKARGDFTLCISHLHCCFKVNLYVKISLFVSAFLFSSLALSLSLLSPVSLFQPQINGLDDYRKS